MANKNAFFKDLRDRIMPQIDDPRKRFMAGLRKSLAGTQVTSRPSTSTPRRRSGVRTGRPVTTSDR